MKVSICEAIHDFNKFTSSIGCVFSLFHTAIELDKLTNPNIACVKKKKIWIWKIVNYVVAKLFQSNLWTHFQTFPLLKKEKDQITSFLTLVIHWLRFSLFSDLTLTVCLPAGVTAVVTATHDSKITFASPPRHIAVTWSEHSNSYGWWGNKSEKRMKVLSSLLGLF